MTTRAPEDALAHVRQAAEAKGLAVEIVPRPDARSLPEAAALLGLQPHDIVKTLVVKRPSGGAPGSDSPSVPEYLFALVPGGRALSWPKLRAVLGVNRVRLPDADAALAATGYARGTITPIGSTTAWPLYADESILGRRVAMGAGAHGYSLFVQADDLVRAYAATVADITVPEE